MRSLTSLDLSSKEIGGAIMHLAKVVNEDRHTSSSYAGDAGASAGSGGVDGALLPALRVLKLSGNVYDMSVIEGLFVRKIRRQVALL